jgi:hypothetical protein
MTLHWHHPKYSMHGDMVELVAPCGRYLIEFGLMPDGRYYVSCCDHINSGDRWEGNGGQQWMAFFPTADEARAYAQHRVETEGWWTDNTVYVEPCGNPTCVELACVRDADERRLAQQNDARFAMVTEDRC